MTTNIVSFIIVLGILIFFHELGHFLIARLAGVGVEKFSLGFGPRLIGKKIGITDYRISAIPLGGFVKMVGDELDAELDPDLESLSFMHKNVFKRISIVAAGPLFNLLLAIIIYSGFFFFIGMDDIRPVINKIEKGSPAENAGLAIQDEIISINANRVEYWSDINRIIYSSKGRTLDITIKRGEDLFDVSIRPELKLAKDLFGDEVEFYDIGASGLEELKAIVGDVADGFPAQKAGLKSGDQIVAINAIPVDNWNTMKDIISSSKGASLTVTVLREDERFSVEIVPVLISEKNILGEKVDSYRIGISTPGVNVPAEDRLVKKMNPLAAMWEGAYQTWKVAELTVIGFVKMIKGSIPAKTLGGPIMIAEMAGREAQAGILNLMFFIAAISINLAILNLLPIPVLDGGHLLFFTIEAISGRPVNTRMREVAQQAGIFILIMLMIFAFYNDITRIFFS
jgi:regulator of sigma E protease